MTRKYRVASAAMFCNMLGILSLMPAISRLDRAAKKIINRNARESDSSTPWVGSVSSDLHSRKFQRTVKQGDARKSDF